MAKLENCLRCGGKLDAINRHEQRDSFILECPKCGKFEASAVEIKAKAEQS